MCWPARHWLLCLVNSKYVVLSFLLLVSACCCIVHLLLLWQKTGALVSKCAHARGMRHLGKILTLNQDLHPNMLQWFSIVFVWRHNASANWFGWAGWSTNAVVNRIRAVFKFSSADVESSDGLVHFCSSYPANVGWLVQSAVAQSSNFEFYIFKMSLPVLLPLIRVAYTMRNTNTNSETKTMTHCVLLLSSACPCPSCWNAKANPPTRFLPFLSRGEDGAFFFKNTEIIHMMGLTLMCCIKVVLYLMNVAFLFALTRTILARPFILWNLALIICSSCHKKNCLRQIEVVVRTPSSEVKKSGRSL